MISRFVCLCLLLSPFYWMQFRHISRFLSRRLPSTGPVPSWFRGLSPLVSLLLDPVSSSWFPGLSPFVSLLLDPVSSCFPVHWFGCLSPFGSLLNFLYKDPFLLWFGGVSYFVFPSLFLAGTWFEVKIVKLVRMWERLFGVDAGVILFLVHWCLEDMPIGRKGETFGWSFCEICRSAARGDNFSFWCDKTLWPTL